MDDLVIGGVALGPIIVSMVEGLKELGMPVEYARVVTGVFTVAAYALVKFSEAYPQYNVYLVPLVTAVVLFLTSTGLYSIGKSFGKSLKKA